MIGFSFLLPPATIPTIARQDDDTTFLDPDGRRRRVFPVSVLCETIAAEFPEHRASLPRSPDFASTLQTIVPSGSAESGTTFPTSMLAIQVIMHHHHQEKNKSTKKNNNNNTLPSQSKNHQERRIVVM